MEDVSDDDDKDLLTKLLKAKKISLSGKQRGTREIKRDETKLEEKETLKNYVGMLL